MKGTKEQSYKEDSIISLSPRDFTRLRPSTYLGSNEYSTQLVRECFANALDEHNIGNGNEIICTIDTLSNTYSIQDFGQGFPINVIRKEDGKTILEAAFSVLNTSGKYDDSKEGIYQGSSLGVNGIGSKLITFLSTKTDVITYNSEGNFEHIWFKDGFFEKREVGNDLFHESGTTVTWQPDPQFFQNKEANIPELKKLFEDISALCPSLTIKFIIDNKEQVFHTKAGIQDFIDKKVGNKEILNTRFACRKEQENLLFDICMTYTSDYSDNTTAYVNYGLTESGVHISTVRAGLTRQINRYAYDNNLLKKNQDAITQTELNEGLFLVFNVKATNVKYDSQTKTKVVDLDKTLINSVINNEFVDWLKANPKDAKIIIDKALVARKAKEAAQKAKENIRSAGAKNKKFVSLPTKLVDAYSKNRSETEIFIVEGDSAANGLIAKRNGKTQAIFPVRGKVLSCRKATVDKIYANQEVNNIVKAIGLDVEKGTGKLIYDVKKLRYNKIILAADSDPDGYDIRLLLINMFWWLCPDLFTNGHIYVALPPLYRITNRKNEYIFLKDDAALALYKKQHKNESYIIGRNKGLGEQNADELAYCLLKPDTRNIKQLHVDDKNFAASDDLLEIFMGNKIEPRREYLLKHLAEIKIDIE